MALIALLPKLSLTAVFSSVLLSFFEKKAKFLRLFQQFAYGFIFIGKRDFFFLYFEIYCKLGKKHL